MPRRVLSPTRLALLVGGISHSSRPLRTGSPGFTRTLGEPPACPMGSAEPRTLFGRRARSLPSLLLPSCPLLQAREVSSPPCLPSVCPLFGPLPSLPASDAPRVLRRRQARAQLRVRVRVRVNPSLPTSALPVSSSDGKHVLSLGLGLGLGLTPPSLASDAPRVLGRRQARARHPGRIPGGQARRRALQPAHRPRCGPAEGFPLGSPYP